MAANLVDNADPHQIRTTVLLHCDEVTVGAERIDHVPSSAEVDADKHGRNPRWPSRTEPRRLRLERSVVAYVKQVGEPERNVTIEESALSDPCQQDPLGAHGEDVAAVPRARLRPAAEHKELIRGR
ncbi:hypothetical protein [Curtobacterium sp. ISL-83]|uniref:hypothetical protein n=1 Tax=Curtobacterium sp. ISL-83 TaxID=2819145 RepID=UPI001BEC1A90|nr:hypothetical protein [Curtobacterium sp. ISL-83]MBT2501067.1 hypothetical protein [Curtobacterium sp. ISL-83]